MIIAILLCLLLGQVFLACYYKEQPPWLDRAVAWVQRIF